METNNKQEPVQVLYITPNRAIGRFLAALMHHDGVEGEWAMDTNVNTPAECIKKAQEYVNKWREANDEAGKRIVVAYDTVYPYECAEEFRQTGLPDYVGKVAIIPGFYYIFGGDKELMKAYILGDRKDIPHDNIKAGAITYHKI